MYGVTMDNMDFETLPKDEVFPNISEHLGTREDVLWQGVPEVDALGTVVTLLAPACLIIFGIGLMTGLGNLLFPQLAFTGGSTTIPGLALATFGAVFLYLAWTRRAATWYFAITTRRLLVVHNNKIVRSTQPSEVRHLFVKGNKVIWRISDTSENSHQNNQAIRGFTGVKEPERLLQYISQWKENLSISAINTATEFAESLECSDSDGANITRVMNPANGLRIDVPSKWEITVDNAYIGSLRVFGFTLLPRIIKRSGQRSYGDGEPWTELKVRGAPDIGLYMTVHDGPLTQTLSDVTDDPWAKKFNLETWQTTDDLQVGSLKGFSVVWKLPKESIVTGFGRIPNEVVTRKVWLGSQAFHIEIVGMARPDMEETQRAIDAMIASINCA